MPLVSYADHARKRHPVMLNCSTHPGCVIKLRTADGARPLPTGLPNQVVQYMIHRTRNEHIVSLEHVKRAR